MERMFAVAVRDGLDLFLWIRIKRAATGDLYYMFPTGRDAKEFKRWDPHGSLQGSSTTRAGTGRLFGRHVRSRTRISWAQRT